MERYFSNSHEMWEPLEPDLEWCAASRRKSILDPRLWNIVAFLQVSRQHLSARKMHMLQSAGRVLVTSRDCKRQSLRRDFEKAPWNEENEKCIHDQEAESQATGYFGIVSERF